MIIGENRVVERGGVLTARGTANSSEDPNEQPHRVVNRSLFVAKSCMAHSNFFCRMCTAQVCFPIDLSNVVRKNSNNFFNWYLNSLD